MDEASSSYSELSASGSQVIKDVPSDSETYLPNLQWMKDHLGDVLVRGVTETLVLRPEDPVEFLGQWLMQQIRNREIEAALLRERAEIAKAVEERNRANEERRRLFEDTISKDKEKKAALQKAQDEAKNKLEQEQRNRELEMIRAERTENKPPPMFGLPETIVEVPSATSMIQSSQSNIG